MFTGFKDWDVEGGNHPSSQGSTVLWEMKGRRAWDWQGVGEKRWRCLRGTQLPQWGGRGWGDEKVGRGKAAGLPPISPVPITIPDRLPW